MVYSLLYSLPSLPWKLEQEQPELHLSALNTSNTSYTCCISSQNHSSSKQDSPLKTKLYDSSYPVLDLVAKAILNILEPLSILIPNNVESRRVEKKQTEGKTNTTSLLFHSAHCGEKMKRTGSAAPTRFLLSEDRGKSWLRAEGQQESCGLPIPHQLTPEGRLGGRRRAGGTGRTTDRDSSHPFICMTINLTRQVDLCAWTQRHFDTDA